jgi:DNA-directed RNA polymerase specialized sigma24 family protein
MSLKSLEEISTQWSQMEDLMEIEGPNALAEFLAARYFEPLALKFKSYRKEIDELKAHELASEVVYLWIKNDYQTLKKLDRNRGKLRGLFTTIIQRVLIDQLWRKKTPKDSLEALEIPPQHLESWIDIYLDFQEAVEALKEKRPLLYTPFVQHYLEGKSLVEIAQESHLEINAIKQRLFSARRWLAQALQDYLPPP